MQVRRVKFFALMLGLFGCAAVDAPGELAKISEETASPPVVERQAIEASVAMFASGRFDAHTPRWFLTKPDVPPIALVKRLDSALRGSALRVVETGPDQADAEMRIWRMKRSNKAILLAIITDPSSKRTGLAACYATTIDPRWRPETVSLDQE